jgi:hypothetical protein
VIVLDDKDWTWVLDRACPECGFDAGTVPGLNTAAGALAERLDAISGDEWQRPGRRSDGASFTIETIARYMIHDPVHHVWDVTRTRCARGV